MTGHHYRLGIDTGGTFTDFMLVGDTGGARLYKAPSRPDDPPAAVDEGLAQICRDLGCTKREFLDGCDLIILGTTVGVNALLETKGAVTGLFCTAGHEDSLEIRLGHKEDGERYNADFPRAPMLVSRALRIGVRERILSTGEVRTPLKREDVIRGIQLFKEAGVEAIAVSLLWSFLYPDHERKIGEIVRKEFPEVYLTLSVDLLPQIREYTRTSTTVVNAYIGPIIKDYVEGMETFLRKLGFPNQVRYMQSNGGLTSGRFLKNKGVYALNSGPAAGPNAGTYFATSRGVSNVVTVDMGGTSFDISLSKNGKTAVVKDSDFLRQRVGVAMLSVETLGAGGGSIASVNEMGLLQVGPKSAGSNPGPACYQKGGTQATVTDALVLLGYLNQTALLGGRLRIDARAARRAIADHVGDKLDLTPESAAVGIFTVVNSNMVSGIRRVSIEKGYDPREFVLVVGGGAGPAHAAKLAEELGIQTVLIPKVSATLCAFGEILSDIKHSYLSSVATRLAELDHRNLNQLFNTMENQGREELRLVGIEANAIEVSRSLDMRYVDQVHECRVEISTEDISDENFEKVADAFHSTHEELFTYSEKDSEVEIMNAESVITGRVSRPVLPHLDKGNEDPFRALIGEREIWNENIDGFALVGVFEGSRLLVGNVVKGPAIIEEATTSIVCFPGWRTTLLEPGTYVMEREEA